MTAPATAVRALIHQLQESDRLVDTDPISLRDLAYKAATHLAAVTAERDQAVRELAEQKRVNTSNLRTMTEQLDQARQMLADAPHAGDCNSRNFRADFTYTCDCWKAGL